MKIVVAGNYGAQNLGDEMILEGLLAVLGNAAPNAEITVLSGNPEETRTKYNIEALPKFPSGIRSWISSIGKRSATEEAVKECDYFILGGGGLFGGPEMRGNFVWASQIKKAYQYKKPVLMLGQSVGKPRNFIEKRLIKDVFRDAKFISVREENSKNVLENLGIRKTIRVHPDFAFKTQVAKKLEEKNILVALRQTPEITKKFKAEVAAFLDSLIEKKWKVNFLNFQEGEGSDQPLHDAIKGMMKHKNSTNTLNSLEEDKSSFILAMRLHSLIYALKKGVPHLTISYASKVKALLDYVYDKNYIEQGEVTADLLKQKFEDAKNTPPTIKADFTELESLLRKFFSVVH